MSLTDELKEITMKQTKGYVEESPNAKPSNTETVVDEVNKEILSGADGDKSPRKEPPNPFKSGDGMSKKKMLMFGGIGIGVVLLAILFYFGYSYMTRDTGADFYKEAEAGDVAPFSYSQDERSLLRDNGYTADDIERYETEERSPTELVQEATKRRLDIINQEVLPYLDGASDEFKKLQALTWLGTGDMSKEVLSDTNPPYEEYYGTYNCDYTKVPAYGAQLFIQIKLADFGNQIIFMSLTPERYKKLPETGNLVINIEYNKYSDGKILVTDVKEKDIQE